MPLDDEDDEEDEDELLLLLLLLLLLDDDEASPDEDELLDDETSPDEDEDELLLELEDELLLTLASVPPMPPIPLEDDDVILAAPAPVAVTGSASLQAPPNVAAQIVTKPVKKQFFWPNQWPMGLFWNGDGYAWARCKSLAKVEVTSSGWTIIQRIGTRKQGME